MQLDGKEIYKDENKESEAVCKEVIASTADKTSCFPTLLIMLLTIRMTVKGVQFRSEVSIKL